MSCGEYLFKVNNEDMKATSKDLVLMFLLLTLNRYFAKRIQLNFRAICKGLERPKNSLQNNLVCHMVQLKNIMTITSTRFLS